MLMPEAAEHGTIAAELEGLGAAAGVGLPAAA